MIALSLAVAAVLSTPAASPRPSSPDDVVTGAAKRRGASHRATARSTDGEVILAGERVPVRWTDGDSFKIGAGPFAGRRARLAAVNALETFGPVHRIGAMAPAELLALAKATAPRAAASVWRCETDGAQDGYGRLLVACSDGAEALVRDGYAMVLAVDGKPPPRLVEAQRAAQAARAGIWARGAPPLVPTSLHSADERDLGRRGAYDRIADTRTGVAAAAPHTRVYATCEERCVGEGPDRACMIYVPYERRYRQRPACLR